MALDSAAVRRLAHLARIAVDDETARSLGTDLEHILAMVELGYPAVRFRNKVEGKTLSIAWNGRGSDD